MKKKWIIVFIVTAIAFAKIYLHTNTLHISLHHVKLGSNKKKLRVAHVSDLHTSGLNQLEKQLIMAIENEKPDLIVITGDLATPSGTNEGYSKVNFPNFSGHFSPSSVTLKKEHYYGKKGLQSRV